MTHRPQVRRGLGRGLGSLIPTAPRPEWEADTDEEPGQHRAGGADGSGGLDGLDRPGSPTRSARTSGARC